MAIPAYYSLIQKGSYGPDEALVQTWLNGVRDQCSYYPALTIDGRFGTRSENAVKEFQLRNNMNMDGKVGANTWNVLYAKYTAKHGLAVPLSRHRDAHRHVRRHHPAHPAEAQHAGGEDRHGRKVRLPDCRRCSAVPAPQRPER